MSEWSYIHGTIVVSPMGRTQAEKRYILDTILEHLPRVDGSEEDMNVYVIQKNGYNCSASCDEFEKRTNNLIDFYGNKSRNGWLETQSEYILVVDGALRDRSFDETLRQFMKWMCRLAKRVPIRESLVSVASYGKEHLIRTDDFDSFYRMFESPSWSCDNKTHEPTWCEYLMWEPAHDVALPLELVCKYYESPKHDAEFYRRHGY